MKCYKFLRSRLLFRCLSIYLCCIVFLSSTIGIKAEEITPTPSAYNGTWVINTTDFLELCWTSACREMSKMYLIGSDAIYGEFEHFVTWLEGDPNYGVLEQYPNTVVHAPLPPTGNTLTDINNSTEIDVPIPVQNTILNFIQYQVANNSLGYKECYIYSYNFISPNQFNNYQMYKSFQEVVKNFDGYTFCRYQSGNQPYLYFTQIPRSDNFAFYGTTLSGGFVSVHGILNWSSISTGPYVQKYMNASGTISEYPSNNKMNIQNMYNVSSLKTNANEVTVFSNFDKNELVYVFDTVNAYKNYNSGSPQDYYLTSEGISDGTWTVNGSGTINTGSMDNSSYYYNSVISNVQTGWTADEVLALVDKISGSSASGGSSDGSDDNTGIWKGIGEAIGSLITGIATVVSEVASALSNAILSIINIFVGENGLFSKLTDLVDNGFSNFLSAVFSWLPPEIVTLFSATLIFGIFFAIWKMLRG